MSKKIILFLGKWLPVVIKILLGILFVII